MKLPRLSTVVTASIAFVVVRAPVLACSVCYGAADDPFVQGSNWTMIFMLALTYGVIGGGIVMAVVTRRGAVRRQQDETDHPHLRLVPDEMTTEDDNG